MNIKTGFNIRYLSKNIINGLFFVLIINLGMQSSIFAANAGHEGGACKSDGTCLYPLICDKTDTTCKLCQPGDGICYANNTDGEKSICDGVKSDDSNTNMYNHCAPCKNTQQCRDELQSNNSGNTFVCDKTDPSNAKCKTCIEATDAHPSDFCKDGEICDNGACVINKLTIGLKEQQEAKNGLYDSINSYLAPREKPDLRLIKNQDYDVCPIWGTTIDGKGGCKVTCFVDEKISSSGHNENDANCASGRCIKDIDGEEYCKTGVLPRWNANCEPSDLSYGDHANMDPDQNCKATYTGCPGDQKIKPGENGIACDQPGNNCLCIPVLTDPNTPISCTSDANCTTDGQICNLKTKTCESCSEAVCKLNFKETWTGGHACINNKCSCTQNSDCPLPPNQNYSYTCNNGNCELPPLECSNSEECTANPNGKNCIYNKCGCAADSDCSTGQSCYSSGECQTTFSSETQACSKDTDCSDGYYCSEFGCRKTDDTQTTDDNQTKYGKATLTGRNTGSTVDNTQPGSNTGTTTSAEKKNQKSKSQNSVRGGSGSTGAPRAIDV